MGVGCMGKGVDANVMDKGDWMRRVWKVMEEEDKEEEDGEIDFGDGREEM